MTDTPLDRAFAAAGGDAADGRVVDALLNAEMLLLLEAPATGDTLRPVLLELEAGRTALAFDTETRLADFGAGADFVQLPGRTLAEMLAGSGVNLAVNPGVAPSELFHDAAALEWMVQMGQAEAQAAEARISGLGAPRAASEALIAALDAKLAALAPLLSEAWLMGARHADGSDRLLLVLAERGSDAPRAGRAFDAADEARRRAVSLAASESARLAAPEGPELDAVFAAPEEPLLETARRHGLGFELPEPKAARGARPLGPRHGPGPPAAPPLRPRVNDPVTNARILRGKSTRRPKG